jgi:hypothetical protein
LIARLQGRKKLLETVGFTSRQAAWITLVCLYSGLFTRHQVETFLGSSHPTSSRFVQRLLDGRLSGKPIARDLNKGGRRTFHVFAIRSHFLSGNSFGRSDGLRTSSHRSTNAEGRKLRPSGSRI